MSDGASVVLPTRLTHALGIRHPVLSAPMAFAAGGRLAAAVSHAGGLGLIGGAYGDGDWIDTAFRDAGNASVGCGLITWALAERGEAGIALLDTILARRPALLMLSFGDPAPFAARIRATGTRLAVQVQTVKDARRAIECGADIVIAQGAEAGGHGERRATMTLVPEIADLIATRSPETLLCAAGGIAEGRGLAAALVLGADGVLVGSRLWATVEADVHPAMHDAAIAATGDDTIRSSVMDIARHLDWPDRYTARVLKNAFTERWHDDLDGLIANATREAELWREAWARGDTRIANTFVGEATGLIDAVEPVGDLIARMVDQAVDRLRMTVPES